MSIAYEPIGHTLQEGDSALVQIDPAFRQGLLELAGFSFVHVIWHADRAASISGNALVLDAPYRNAPERIGVFATRSPQRPNPICMTVTALIAADAETGAVRLGWLDCEPDTPVLDIKPYHPSSDRVMSAKVPDWCASWPRSLEESGSFDWGAVFSF